MSAYLGEIGSLVEVQCAADLSTDVARPVRYQSTLGGATFAQVGPRTRRSWDVRLPRTSTPADVATWQAFIEGEHGPGPWWFISETAAVSNVITARGSLLESELLHAGTSQNGGPMRLTDGRSAGRSWLVQPSTILHLPWVEGRQFTPIVPGVPVTASAWVDGPGAPRMRVAVYRADGSVSRQVSGTNGVANVPTRITVTFTPTEYEAYCLIFMAGAPDVYRIARPAISFTSTAMPWSVGEGAEKVHLSAVSTDTTLAIEGRTFLGAQFKIQEVG